LPLAVPEKASFVDSSGHAGQDFVFTDGRKKDSNETAVHEEFNKMKSPIGSHNPVVAVPCGQLARGGREG